MPPCGRKDSEKFYTDTHRKTERKKAHFLEAGKILFFLIFNILNIYFTKSCAAADELRTLSSQIQR